MLKEAIEYVVGLNNSIKTIEEVDGRKYFTHGGKLSPVLRPEAETMEFSTLMSLVEWAKNQGENSTWGPYFVVEGYNKVSLYSTVFGEFHQRCILAEAVHECPSFSYGQFMDTEDFIVHTQTRFEMTETLSNLLKIVGNVKEEAVKTLVDDGISQEVTARERIGTVSNVTLPNPVNLKPFKTFPEIDSP